MRRESIADEIARIIKEKERREKENKSNER